MKNSFEVKEAKRKKPLSLRQGNKRLRGASNGEFGGFFFKHLTKGPLTFLSFLSEALAPGGEKEDEKAHRKCKWSLLTCDFRVTMASGMWLNVHFLSKQVRELCAALKECIVCVCVCVWSAERQEIDVRAEVRRGRYRKVWEGRSTVKWITSCFLNAGGGLPELSTFF